MEREWTALEVIIKRMMLAYPTLYKSRLSCLRRLFLSSYSVKWNVEGDMIDEERNQFKPLSRDEFIAKGFSEIDKLEHALRFDNIDLYVLPPFGHHDWETRDQIILDILRDGVPSYCAAVTAPAYADETMLAGLNEIISEVSAKCRQIGKPLQKVLTAMDALNASPCFDRQHKRSAETMQRLHESGFFEKLKNQDAD